MAQRSREHAEQRSLMAWARLAQAKWPELALLHAIPNGGHRNRVAAARIKAEGARRGVPDLCLPVPRGEHHGLYIELKAGKGRPSREQRWWLAALRMQGYRAVLCRGWQAARAEIDDYLDGPAAHAGRGRSSSQIPAQGARNG